MRLTILVAAAAILMPVALAASPASAPGLSTSSIADLSAAKKKKKPAPKKEEYLKAAPSAPPSSGKSTY